MRTIKFRGKSDDNGTWVYGDLHLISKYPHIHTTPFDKVFIKKETVGQFIGLYDKNKKEIYEGDILKVREMHIIRDEGFINHITTVVFKAGIFCLKEGDKTYYELGCFDINETEVIGNIYDNKELLTQN